jgi:hypothetical protein
MGMKVPCSDKGDMSLVAAVFNLAIAFGFCMSIDTESKTLALRGLEVETWY